MSLRQRSPHGARVWSACALAAVLVGCGTTGRDGPPGRPPSGLERTPDAVPRVESIRSGGPNKPYVINGRRYTPETRDLPLTERGLASWYGTRFHGLPTANGETYDMYGMTAAHPTMPLPSYARVRNPANGREVIVRINDRGPFHPGRVIDLSYAAALRLGLLRGVAPVEIERITNDAIRTASWRGAPMAAAANDGVDEQVPARRDDELSARSAATTATAGTETAGTTAATPAMPPGQTEDGSPAITASSPGAPVAVAGAPSRLPSSGPTAPSTSPPADRAGAPDGTTASSATTHTTSSLPGSPTATASALPSMPSLPVAPTARPATDAGPGWWVQLGAFGQRAGAQGFGRQVAGEVSWLAPLLAVFDDGRLHRLQAGPYASRDEASAVADRLREALKLVPVLIERR